MACEQSALLTKDELAVLARLIKDCDTPFGLTSKLRVLH
jgi:hypothetical protein